MDTTLQSTQGCICLHNTETPREAVWQADQILFQLPSSATAHLNAFNKHFSSLTSAPLRETKAALLIPCLWLSLAD